MNRSLLLNALPTMEFHCRQFDTPIFHRCCSLLFCPIRSRRVVDSASPPMFCGKKQKFATRHILNDKLLIPPHSPEYATNKALTRLLHHPEKPIHFLILYFYRWRPIRGQVKQKMYQLIDKFFAPDRLWKSDQWFRPRLNGAGPKSFQ